MSILGAVLNQFLEVFGSFLLIEEYCKEVSGENL